MPTEEDSVQVIYMDEKDNVVPKAEATRVRIIEYKNGQRFETYGTKDKG